MRRWSSTRPTFANPERIRKSVLDRQDNLDGIVEGWWRKKYKSPLPWGDRTRGDLIEEYYWDLLLRKEDLEAEWKERGGEHLVRQIEKLTQILKGTDPKPGKTGDEWFDDWDGEEEEETPPKQPAVDEHDDDWQDVKYGH